MHSKMLNASHRSAVHTARCMHFSLALPRHVTDRATAAFSTPAETSVPHGAHSCPTMTHRHAGRGASLVPHAAMSSASPLPATPQDAIQDAVQCVSVRLKPRMSAGKAPSKGFASGSSASARENLHIEIPTADQSPAAVAQLAVDVTAALASSLGGSATPMLIVCSDPKVASAISASRSKPSGCRVMELKEACRQPKLEGSLLVVVAPATSDVALCQQLTDETWTGKGTVMVNAEFIAQPPVGLTGGLSDYMEEVVTVYCILPVAVKGLLGAMEGVVLRRATGKGGDSNLWKILMKAPGKGEQYLQIGQTKRRPSSDDLQLAFINANAANSPVNKLVAKLRGQDKK